MYPWYLLAHSVHVLCIASSYKVLEESNLLSKIDSGCPVSSRSLNHRDRDGFPTTSMRGFKRRFGYHICVKNVVLVFDSKL